MQQSPSWEADRFSASQEIPRIVWNPKAHTGFKTALHLSLSWARSIQCIPSHPTSWIFILILSSHLRLGLASSLFPSGVPTKFLYTPILPHTCYMPHPSHYSRFDHPSSIWWVQIINFLIMYFSPLPCYLILLGPEYSLQNLILKHPQPTFLPEYERPSCIPIQKTR